MTALPTDTLSLSHRTLVLACRELGLDSGNATPIRIAENALWRLPDRIVARIGRPGRAHVARREIAVAGWLAGHGIPVVRPLPGVGRPVTVNGRPVTFWEELPSHRNGSVQEMAHLLRALHALPAPDFPLETLEPFGRIWAGLSLRTPWEASTVRRLRDHAAGLEEAWDELLANSLLPRCVLHGDAWVGNVASAADGTAYLIDLESFAIGPREWDLTSTAAKLTSTGTLTRAEYEDFCAVYGTDVTAWHGYPLLRDIRELRMTVYAARIAAEHPDHPQARQEARYRAACVIGQRGPRPWLWTAVP
ncbi:phosphotransferase enzyme family protein [Streptomyces sp. NPDC055992]|uniref:phosphotransferase enzyme family protein n=1 Tax=Streptomyces sp. NPDC055992 TaxID=3345673 RepID=UPI0035DAFBB7